MAMWAYTAKLSRCVASCLLQSDVQFLLKTSEYIVAPGTGRVSGGLGGSQTGLLANHGSEHGSSKPVNAFPRLSFPWFQRPSPSPGPSPARKDGKAKLQTYNRLR